jgi:hypothetical protein
MVEVYPNLFIGNEYDYEHGVRHQQNWRVVHACKEPYHRRALGYTGRAAPKEHPEYLIARRDHRLVLNLVDAPNPAYIPKVIIDTALQFIHQGLQAEQRVLVHCNLGESRAPGIGLLYLAAFAKQLPTDDFLQAEVQFRTIYPVYNPGLGIRGFLKAHWQHYRQG